MSRSLFARSHRACFVINAMLSFVTATTSNKPDFALPQSYTPSKHSWHFPLQLLHIFNFHSIMHTVWVRLNAVVFFGLTVLLGLSCMAAISKIGHASRYQPSKYFALWSFYATLFYFVPHRCLSIYEPQSFTNWSCER